MSALGKLPIIDNRASLREMLETWIKALAVPGQTLKILEAGCGRRWSMRLGKTPYELTGVDLDEVAMEHRKNVQKDLHHAVLADLRTVEFPAASFDVIYNAYVLEHIKGAEDVLRRFTSWLVPGGIVIIFIPDPMCVRGAVTRLTPHWFHVFLCKYLMRVPHAGEPGHVPYRVYYDPVVSRKGMHRFCNENGMKMVGEYGESFSHLGEGLMGKAVELFKKCVGALTFGIISARHNNLIYILQKPVGTPSKPAAESAHA